MTPGFALYTAFLAGRQRTAREHALAHWCIRHAGNIEWTGDFEFTQMGIGCFLAIVRDIPVRRRVAEQPVRIDR